MDIVTTQLFLIRVIVLHCTSPSEATLALLRLTITCGSTENSATDNNCHMILIFLNHSIDRETAGFCLTSILI